MKKILSLLTAAALAITMTGCTVNVTHEEPPQNTGANEEAKESVVVRVGGLKGPTSMGLLCMKDSDKTEGSYDITMATAADELLPMMIKGELDIALVPVNVAAILYNKTEGGVSAVDVNTLGVLYVVTSNDEIQSIADLSGQTVYLTGKGTMPEYTFKYLLDKNGIGDDVKLEFKSEPTEVAAILAEDESAVGLLPQPFVTAACIQNENLKVAFGLSDEWDKAAGDDGSAMVTGVTVVRNRFLSEHPDEVKAFLSDHAMSADEINADPEKGAALAVEAGIVAKEPIAKKAIPDCSIVCITGDKMKEMISGYLQVLFDADASSVGGKLPGEEFYYIGN